MSESKENKMSNAGDLKISANCSKAQLILAILDWSELTNDWLVGEASWRPRLPLEEGCRQGRGWPEVGGDRGWSEVAEVTEADAGTRASIWHSGQSCGRGNISCNIGNISLVVVEILPVATIII